MKPDLMEVLVDRRLQNKQVQKLFGSIALYSVLPSVSLIRSSSWTVLCRSIDNYFCIISRRTEYWITKSPLTNLRQREPGIRIWEHSSGSFARSPEMMVAGIR